MFTYRHHREIGDIIESARQRTQHYVRQRTADDVALKIADWLSQDNPQFDRAAFLAHAGVVED